MCASVFLFSSFFAPRTSSVLIPLRMEQNGGNCAIGCFRGRSFEFKPEGERFSSLEIFSKR